MSSSSVSNHLPPGAPLVPRTVRAWLPLLVHPHPPDVAPRAAVADHQGGVADTPLQQPVPSFGLTCF